MAGRGVVTLPRSNRKAFGVEEALHQRTVALKLLETDQHIAKLSFSFLQRATLVLQTGDELELIGDPRLGLVDPPLDDFEIVTFRHATQPSILAEIR